MKFLIEFSSSSGKLSPPVNTSKILLMFRTILNFRMLLMVLALLALCTIGPFASAKPGAPKGTKGQYEIQFVGSYVGVGQAKVNPARVMSISGNVTDQSTGASGVFTAFNINLDDGHFSGPGTVLGIPVTVSGRVEAGDGKTVLVPRIICNFTTTGGVCGRIVGNQ